MKKLFYFKVLAVLCFSLSSKLIFAQGVNGFIAVHSCYQTVVFDGPAKSFNMLESTKYKFSYPATSTVDYFRIQTYDANGFELTYDYNGLVTTDFPLAIHSTGGFTVVTASTVVGGSQIFNQELFSFDSDVKSVLITPYHWTGTAPNETLDPSNYTATFNLKTGAEAFSFEPTGNSCYTFDNFATSYSNILDGFCGTLSAQVSIVPPVPAGWSPVFSQTIDLNGTTDITTPTNYCLDECGNMTAPYYLPDPVPCECIDFKLDITVSPCTDMQSDCPDLDFSIDIEICCSCDVRENPPAN